MTSSANAKTTPELRPLRAWWAAALACFILAGSTGAFFRFSMAHGALPMGLHFDNVRRAHSHLMFFSWVTPALMALVAARLERRPTVVFGRAVRRIIAAAIALGLASFVPFLLAGYTPMDLGGHAVPLSIIFATAEMFTWYAFAVVYRRRTRGVPRDSALALWDIAVIAMVLSSVGAWARGALVGMHVTDPFWTNAAVHFFLGIFSDGWLAVAALALVHDHLGVQMRGRQRWLTALIAVGLPMTFVLGMPPSVVPPALWSLATVAGLLVGAGFVGHAVVLWRAARRRWAEPNGRLWAAAIACFALKGLAQMMFIVPVVSGWAEGAGLRILYLHVLFLGAVTLTLVESARQTWGNVTARHSRSMQVAVGLLLVTMLPTTGLWPSAWVGMGGLWITAAGSVLPIACAVWMLLYIAAIARQRTPDAPRPTRQKARWARLDDRPDAAPSLPAPARARGPRLVDDAR